MASLVSSQPPNFFHHLALSLKLLVFKIIDSSQLFLFRLNDLHTRFYFNHSWMFGTWTPIMPLSGHYPCQLLKVHLASLLCSLSFPHPFPFFSGLWPSNPCGWIPNWTPESWNFQLLFFFQGYFRLRCCSSDLISMCLEMNADFISYKMLEDKFDRILSLQVHF